MSATARHHMRFLLAVAVATTVASSAAPKPTHAGATSGILPRFASNAERDERSRAKSPPLRSVRQYRSRTREPNGFR